MKAHESYLPQPTPIRCSWRSVEHGNVRHRQGAGMTSESLQLQEQAERLLGKVARAPGKRLRELPVPGEPLCVELPEITEVFEVNSGRLKSARETLGTDYAAMMQLRTRLKAASQDGAPLMRCSTCMVPVFICGRPDGLKFFFKHAYEDGNCPAITRGDLDPDEINARRYNGVKESEAHRQMKDWLEASLQADSSRFSSVQKEARWNGQITGEWRRPDVSAVYQGIRVAFEIQLTTTYLDVIVKRREFYRQHGGVLLWVFASFDNEHRRLTENDVFYNNNQNAFIVNANTTRKSLQDGRFMLECAWEVPTLDATPSALRRQVVAFDELTLDPVAQRAYFYDFDREKSRLQALKDAEVQKLRDEIDAWWDRRCDEPTAYQVAWEKFAPRLNRLGILSPYLFREVDTVLLTALYSAKHNRPWGQRKKRLVEVAHHLAVGERDRFVWFMHAVKKYGRTETMAKEGDASKWASKLASTRYAFKAEPSAFLPQRKSQALAEFLFPELLPFPDPASKIGVRLDSPLNNQLISQ